MRTSNSLNSNPCKHLLRLLKSPSKKRPYANSPRWSTRTPSFKVARATNPSTPRRRKPRFVLPAAFRQSHIRSSTAGTDASGLSSLTESMRDTAPFPTPRTPSMFVDLHEIVEDAVVEEEDVEDACRWFVWCLTEMVVDEGNLRDLRDVEDLVGCWNELRSPVFVGVVRRFYVEVCMDLFSGGDGVALYDEEVDEGADIVAIRT